MSKGLPVVFEGAEDNSQGVQMIHVSRLKRKNGRKMVVYSDTGERRRSTTFEPKTMSWMTPRRGGLCCGLPGP